MSGFILAVSALGYTIPLAVILVVLAVVVGTLLVVVFGLITSISVYWAAKRSRRDQVRPDLRNELLDRLFAATPRWNEWVADLTAVEREVAESLLDEHLRELEGDNADTLRELGDTLGIPDRAGQRLKTGNEYTRLRALTWLTLLRRPDPYLESSFEPDTPHERAAVVRLLEKTDQLPDRATGISVLLDGINGQFSVFGQDTLYHVARIDPTPLLRTASEAHNEWPEPLLWQVLAIGAHLETSVRDGELAWLMAVLEKGNEAMRAAAADALAAFGWRTSLREQPVFDRAVNDPSAKVRAAVYRMLASWGDEAARTALRDALADEPDPRALTAGTTALVRHKTRLEFDPAGLFGDAWRWSVEHTEYDRIARQVDQPQSPS